MILDARRFDEYQTMSIPGGISVPGAELVLRVAELAPDPRTRVIVNCAGRTRSIIGTQSLLNAGIPNPVAALRNGTIGWTLAGQQLEHGQTRRFGAISQGTRKAAAQRARAVADRAGVERLDLAGLAQWQDEHDRTTYLLDVRTPEEYEACHLPGSRSTPGGQLVQETDHVASVRGAPGTGGRRWRTRQHERLLAGPDGLAGRGTGRTLRRRLKRERRLGAAPLPRQPRADTIDPTTLADWLGEPGTRVLDFTASANYAKRHIPGAAWVLRSQLKQALERLGTAERYVLTCGSSLLARFAVAEVQALSGKPVFFSTAAPAPGSPRACRRKTAKACWRRRASTATAAPTKVPTIRAKRCRATWTGSSAWWSNSVATELTASS